MAQGMREKAKQAMPAKEIAAAKAKEANEAASEQAKKAKVALARV